MSEDWLGVSDRAYRMLILGVPLFFVVQTVYFAAMPFRLSTSVLAIQLLALGPVWVYSIYYVLGPQGYFQAVVSGR